MPKAWRSGMIIPILKKDKTHEDLESYRPITLLANLGKVMERLIANRLTWWLEKKGAISQSQASFRRGRSTVDQCLRMSQGISDGFQLKPPEWTLTVLLDYSRAFDTVWRACLLDKMMGMGVPATFIKWTSAYLVNRTARVKLGEATGRQRVYREGLPQGAVLSPLLFIIFINDLLDEFGEGTLASAFAADLAIACSHMDKERAQALDQEETNKVVSWSKKWCSTSTPPIANAIYSPPTPMREVET